MIGIRVVVFSLYAYVARPLTKVLYTDRIEKSADLLADIQPHLLGDAFVRSGALLFGRLAGAKDELEGTLGGPDNVTQGNIFRLLEKKITTVGASLASQDVCFFQLLKNLFEITWADLLTPGDILDLGGKTHRVVCDVE